MLNRRALLGGLCTCTMPLITSCQTLDTGRLQSDHQPAAHTDEAGLWQLFDDFETQLERSPARIDEGNAEAYLTDVACRLAGSHCTNLRVYLVNTPYFNASMAPNGMMEVWSGLLLRVENEAQLATIIGHEIGHFIERHSLERWRTIRASVTTAQLFGMGIAVAGGGTLANLPTLVALAEIYAYNRDQEREADAIGLDLMTGAGYAADQAPLVWQNLIEESAADPHTRQTDIFFATHPQPEERRDTLRAAATRYDSSVAEIGKTPYLEEVRYLRGQMLEDEVGLRQPERSIVVIERLQRQEPGDGQLTYYLGEVYRLRGRSGDLDRALGLFDDAAGMEGSPGETWRAIGLIHQRQGRDDLAADAFSEYLRRAPDAPDAELIRSYLPST